MSLREFSQVPSVTDYVGKSFLMGYGAGVACGTILGLTKHIEKPTLDTKNLTKQYATRLGYSMGVASSLHTVTREVTKEIGYIESHTIAGGIAGAAIGAKWGIKGALGCGLIGAALGASYAYSERTGKFDHLIKNQEWET